MNPTFAGPSLFRSIGSLSRWLVVATAGLAAACNLSPPQRPAPEPAAPPTARPAIAPSNPAGDITRLDHPIIISGDASLVAAREPKRTPDSAGEPGDITLNFVDLDVREVVRSVLGDVLHLNYTVDPKVQATVTLQTSRPLRRDEVLPTLQVALRTSGAAVVEEAGVYRIVPIEEAAHTGAAPLIVEQTPSRPSQGGNPNYNVQVFPLKYVSANEMRQLVEPLLPKGAVVEVDQTRNLLIISGSGQDLSTAVEMLRTFDVDILKGMSFGIFPLQLGTPKAIANELNNIFGPNGTVPLAGVLRFAPLERMNAILAVAPQRAYIEQARDWIDRLEKGGEDNTPRLFQYHVQNSRATDLAKVLSELLTGGQVQTVGPPGQDQSFFGGAGGAGGAGGLGGGGLGNAAGGGGGLGGSPLGGSPLGGGGAPLSTGAVPSGLAGATPGGAPGIGASPSFPPQGSPSSTSPGSPAGAGAPSSRSQAPGLASALGSAFGTDRAGNESPFSQVRIVADEKNNALVIYAPPRQYRLIEDALKRLDVVPLQVLIEATIAEVTLNDNLSYGTQFFLQKPGASIFSLSNNITTRTPAAVLPGFNYTFLASGINVVLSALSAVTDVDVVSSPELLVLDHHEASLQVGQEVPILTAQVQQTVTNGAPVVNTVSYVSTGVILHVRPQVNQNGVITLDISQEVSDVTTTTSSALGSPTINQRLVQTTVSVADGQTVALGGLITENRTLSNSGVPLLKDVPLFGGLFGTRQNQKGRTELLVLLSPRVLHDAAEARGATEELRGRLHTIAPLVGRVR
jgi:general secretion pathway protein D